MSTVRLRSAATTVNTESSSEERLRLLDDKWSCVRFREIFFFSLALPPSFFFRIGKSSSLRWSSWTIELSLEWQKMSIFLANRCHRRALSLALVLIHSLIVLFARKRRRRRRRSSGTANVTHTERKFSFRGHREHSVRRPSPSLDCQQKRRICQRFPLSLIDDPKLNLQREG